MNARATFGVAQAAFGALLVAPAVLGAQRPAFAPTLFWESGLINAPAAYVAPLGGDISFNFVRVTLTGSETQPDLARNTNYNLSLAGSLWGRGELGISVFTGDPSSGLFGKVMLVDQTNGTWRRGLIHWLPSVAVGVRNIGGEILLNRLASSGSTRITEAPSLYGVATRTIALGAVRAGDDPRPAAQISLTAGWGTGLFRDDGGLGSAYAPSAALGAFGGVTLDFATASLSGLSLIVEHDAWAMNAGVRGDFRGIRLAAYATELDGAKRFALSMGWQANILTILRGNRLEQRTAQVERAQGDLARQARQAEQRIELIQGQIDALRAIASQQQTVERTDLERRLREEQDALKRLQDLIKARDAAKKPPQDGAPR